MRVLPRSVTTLTIAIFLVCMISAASAQDNAQKESVEQRLRTQFTTTKLTADKSDIVTPGSILLLHKDGLQMCSIEAKAPIINTYKGGTISFGFGAKMMWGAVLARDGQKSSGIPQRKFVAGEKFFLTGYVAASDGVTLTFYSDPYDEVRYYGQLKFPYAKGTAPSADEVDRMISEVVTSDGGPQVAPAPVAATEPAFQAVAPPPPPPDAAPAEPATVSLGQTKNQVMAILGPPQKVANLGAKEIDYYSDMKVIFVKGKVSDVQ